MINLIPITFFLFRGISDIFSFQMLCIWKFLMMCCCFLIYYLKTPIHTFLHLCFLLNSVDNCWKKLLSRFPFPEYLIPSHTQNYYFHTNTCFTVCMNIAKEILKLFSRTVESLKFSSINTGDNQRKRKST